jgi:hypothetical protein
MVDIVVAKHIQTQNKIINRKMVEAPKAMFNEIQATQSEKQE